MYISAVPSTQLRWYLQFISQRLIRDHHSETAMVDGREYCLRVDSSTGITNAGKESEQLVHLPPCSCCGKHRTPRRHDAIQPLDQIICRRRGCEKLKSLIKDISTPSDIVIKINHYHFGQKGPVQVPEIEPPEKCEGSSAIGRVELPGSMAMDDFCAGRDMYHFGHRPQLAVTTSNTAQGVWEKTREAYMKRFI